MFKLDLEKVEEPEVTQSCLTLCDPMDCSLPASSIHGIFQARTVEWVAISFSRGFSQPRDWTQVSHIIGRRFTVWATGEVQFTLLLHSRPITQETGAVARRGDYSESQMAKKTVN